MKQLPLISVLAILLTIVTPIDAHTIRVLIVDGQNNHKDWPKTTAMMKGFFEQMGCFEVDIARTKFTWNGGQLAEEYPLDDHIERVDLPQPKSDPDFRPEFSKYEVVVSNLGHAAAAWPKETEIAFERFVKQGGGFVVVHAADNSFPHWPAYNRMIGLGGWGGRNEAAGPYVYLNEEEETVRDTSAGQAGGHGPQHEFQIVIRNPNHPTTKGLPRVWLHTKDELYQQLRGPAEKMTILATAYADREHQGSGHHEPMLMAIEYGEGRIFHTTLGHADYSMTCVGFVTTLIRGTEWAATGKVTLSELPEDFPTATKSSTRAF